jgi:hypothetical protein
LNTLAPKVDISVQYDVQASSSSPVQVANPLTESSFNPMYWIGGMARGNGTLDSA